MLVGGARVSPVGGREGVETREGNEPVTNERVVLVEY